MQPSPRTEAALYHRLVTVLSDIENLGSDFDHAGIPVPPPLARLLGREVIGTTLAKSQIQVPPLPFPKDLPHATVKTTPAVAAGIASHAWTVEDLVGLLEAEEAAVVGTEKNKRGPYRNRNA